MTFFARIAIVCFFSLGLANGVMAQNKDSLHRELRKTTSVIQKAKIFNQLVEAWGVTELDSADVYIDKGIELLQQYYKKRGSKKETDLLLAEAYMKKSFVLTTYDKNSEAITMLLRALDMAKRHDDLNVITGLSHNLAYAYKSKGILDSARYYYKKTVTYSEKMNDSSAIGRSYTGLAVVEIDLGLYNDAEKSIKKSIAFYEALRDQENVFGAYITAAQMYDVRGDVKLSLTYYRKAQAAAEKSGSYENLCAVYNDLGVYYGFLRNDEEAIRHLHIALKYAFKLKSLRQRELCYYNLAGFYEERHQNDSARYYLKKSRELIKQIEIPERDLRNNNMMAAILMHEKKYQQAIDILLKGVKAFDEMGDVRGQTTTRIDLVDCYLALGNTSKALEWALQAQELDKISSDIYHKRNIHRVLATIYEKQGNTALAFYHFKTFTRLRDSLMNMENVRELAAHQFKYTYEKKQYADSVKFAQKDKQRKLILSRKNAEISRQRTQRFALFGGLILVIIFSAFIFNRFRLTSKQKKIIEEQKILVEEKQKEVLDSIKYAKRIQDALLKEENNTNQQLPQHFIFYRPKDIVSGDFYWMQEKDNFLYIAAADCTGHGVPGAFLTMLGTSYLNEITSKTEVLRPADILNQLRDKFIRELSQHGKEGESKDGMDIALCAIEFRISNSELNTDSKLETGNSPVILHFAGANNPLWIVKSEKGGVKSDYEKSEEHSSLFTSHFSLSEVRADKQPIGYHDKPMPFTHHEIALEQGDTFYIFTDGFQDQFGGDKGKKFKASGMKNLFLQWQHQTMAQQQQQLENVFDEWKKGFEQIDDVCVIGVRI